MHLIEMEIDPEMNFFCPITGKQVLGPKGFQASKALAFVYSPNANDFELIQPWAKKIWDSVESRASGEEMQEELFDQFMAKLKKYPNLVAFSFLCDGPFAVENVICFDFAHGADNHQEAKKAGPSKKAKRKPAKNARKKR